MSLFSPYCVLDLQSDVALVWHERTTSTKQVNTPLDLLVRGRVTDEIALGAFLRPYLLLPHHMQSFVLRPKVLASVAFGLTSVEKQAVRRAVHASGIPMVQLVNTALCAASGAGVDLTSSHAAFLLSCGAQYSEFSILISGVQTQGFEVDCSLQSIAAHLIVRIHQELSCEISEATARSLVAAHVRFMKREKKDVRVPVKYVKTGKVSDVTIPWELLGKIADEFLESQAVVLEQYMRTMSAALAADILEQGILLHGRYASLPGFSLALSGRLRVPVSVIPEPETCVIRGLQSIASSISFAEYENEEDENRILGE